jgi:hypothetical protein
VRDFDLERFLDLSGAVRIADLDWEAARRMGITPGEARILRYMSDVESHTILYMRDLLGRHGARDPEITAFLSVWVYEELCHGRAIDRFLTAVGYPPRSGGRTRVTARAALKEALGSFASRLAAAATPKFTATHMAWGAINELTAAAAYLALERHTANPVLATLSSRLAKQERKHFAFYYSQANRRLEGDAAAQMICRVSLKWLWGIVGSGVGNGETLEYLAATLFGDEASRRVLGDADETIARLPGLTWFSMIRPAVEALARRHESSSSNALASLAVRVSSPSVNQP